MIACPSCGGEVRFSIEEQQLVCDHCGTKNAPSAIGIQHDAEQDYYEVNVFHCPHCGGEIISEDTSITNFCSYCGSKTILSGKIERERCPDYIIPFQKTKNDCKKAYKKYMRKAIFAPSALKSAKHIEEFRGVYLPYWNYSVVQNNNVSVPCKKKERVGSEEYELTAQYHARVDAKFENIIHDASSSFDDMLSASVAPFDAKSLKPFLPAYLCGFYGDTADVDSSVYEEDVRALANQETATLITTRPMVVNRGIQITTQDTMQTQFQTQISEIKRSMFPVWFLAYRNKNRVAYATVNGETGKIAADLPIGYGKFFIGTLLLAVILFFGLNMTLTLKPVVMLMFSAIFLAISMGIFFSEMQEIEIKEKHLADKRYFAGTKKKRRLFVGAYLSVGVIAIMSLFSTSDEFLAGLGWFVATGIGIYNLVHAITIIRRVEHPDYIGIVSAILSMVIQAVIFFVHPVSDYYYYAGIAISLFVSLITYMNVLHYQNVLATRPMPQFAQHKGGDDGAE